MGGAAAGVTCPVLVMQDMLQLSKQEDSNAPSPVPKCATAGIGLHFCFRPSAQRDERAGSFMKPREAFDRVERTGVGRTGTACF